MRYPFIDEQGRHYPVSLLTRVMRVDRRGYYRWLALKGKPTISPSKVRRHQAVALIRQIFSEEKGKVGSRSIVGIMGNKGHVIGRFQVRAIMREQGLNCRIRKAYKGTHKQPNQAFIFAKHNGLPNTDKCPVGNRYNLYPHHEWLALPECRLGCLLKAGDWVQL